MRFSYSVGRVPLSLLRVSGVVLISRASEVILAMSSGGLDSTSTFSQSIGWSMFHICSASAEELKSACLTARLCSAIRCDSLRLDQQQTSWPGHISLP